MCIAAPRLAGCAFHSRGDRLASDAFVSCLFGFFFRNIISSGGGRQPRRQLTQTWPTFSRSYMLGGLFSSRFLTACRKERGWRGGMGRTRWISYFLMTWTFTSWLHLPSKCVRGQKGNSTSLWLAFYDLGELPFACPLTPVVQDDKQAFLTLWLEGISRRMLSRALLPSCIPGPCVRTQPQMARVWPQGRISQHTHMS